MTEDGIEIRKVNNIDNNLTKVSKSTSKLNKWYESCDEKFKLVPGATRKKIQTVKLLCNEKIKRTNKQLRNPPT